MSDDERTSRRKAFLALMLVPGSTFSGRGPGGSVVTLDTAEFEEAVRAVMLITEIETTKHFVTLLSTGSSLAEMVFPGSTPEELNAVSGVLEGFADAMGKKASGLQVELDEL